MPPVRALALVLLAACGGREPPVNEPSPRAAVRVVRCAPATPPPMISAAGLAIDPLGSARELARFRLRGHSAREAFATPKPVDIDSVVVVSGAAVRAVAIAELGRVMTALEACLERHKDVQTVPATVTTSFSIEPDGTLSLVNTSGTAATEVRSCVTEAFRAQRLSSSLGSRVAVRVKLNPSALAKEPPEPETPEHREAWTPYAIQVVEQNESAPQVARSLEAALRGRVAAFERCFTGSPVTGSLRLMLEVDEAGRVEASRIGGVGDHAVERCVGAAVEDVAVAMPTEDSVEIACDLSRGDAAPWRVTPEAGYGVIEVTRTQVTHGSDALAPDEADPEPLPGGVTYLVIVDPATPGPLLDRAIAWAHEGDGTLVAMRAPSGPPVLLGAARSIYAVADELDGHTREATVAVGSKTVTTCERAPHRRGGTHAIADAALSDPRAVSLLVSELAARCRQVGCTGTLGVAIDKLTAAHELVEVVSAARRHGFERVMLGSGGCASAAADDDE